MLSGTREPVLRDLAGRLGERASVVAANLADSAAVDGLIEAAETAKAAAEAALADPSVYADAGRVPALSAALEAATAEVDRLYARWQELQEKDLL